LNLLYLIPVAKRFFGPGLKKTNVDENFSAEGIPPGNRLWPRTANLSRMIFAVPKG
jgi:hypothetical protein